MIIKSIYTEDAHEQQGGGRYVIERHTDDAGMVYQVGPYLAPEKFDVAARMASRALEIDSMFAALTLEKQEQEASDAKVVAALDTAVKAGALTEDDIKRAGYTAPSEKIAGVRKQ